MPGLPATFPFVGRAAELQTLRSLLPRAGGDGRRIALLGGAPGSGKTRLARELAGEAAGAGMLVLAGGCDAMVRTPYGPFAEALEHLARALPAEELRIALGAAGGELTRLLPGLPARVGDLPEPISADPDTERHRLHTAVGELLAAVSARRAVLLVVEDAHWADAPTLLLLRYLARAAEDARMLVLVTFRDAEADVPRELAETLADLRRRDAATRLGLGGLTGDEVADFVRGAAAAADGAPDLARAIGELTGGNAFLVCELWRALVETGAIEVSGGAVRVTRPLAELGTPESVREVVSERLARLGPGTTDLLELAATAGREFELDVIGGPSTAVLEHVDEAVRSGMIEELPSRMLAYRFTHELVRRALYDRLSGIRRAELHLRVGEALERGGVPSGRRLPDLAHHFTAAAPLDPQRRGVDYNVRAGRAAMAALAFGEAVAHLRTALELEIGDERQRAEVLLALGSAAHRAGKSADAQDAFRRAAAIARATGEALLLARAAIGFEDACWRPGTAEPEAVELLEEATAALGGATSETCVALLSGLARALDFQGDHRRAAVVRASAIDMARELEDRAGLATVLTRSFWSRGMHSNEEVLGMLAEAEEIAVALGHTELRAEAIGWRIPTLVALGDMDAARREVAALEATAEQTAQPFMLHVAAHYGSAIALSDGRLETAEALARRSHEWSRLLTGRDASGTYGIQMFGLRREQGRLAELAPVIRALAAQPVSGPWRPGLAAVLVELGMEAEARRELARVAADGLETYRESLWLASLTFLADAAAALRDETVAALVYPHLEPLAGSVVMIGQLVSCYGAADRHLGMLAATLGRWDRAEEHFARATELNRRTGMLTWLGHTLYEHARARLARGDRDGAAALLHDATALAERCGLTALLARAHALRGLVPASPPPDGLSYREVQILALVARGLSNREIGAKLSISEHTAANHVRSILRKTGCANRTQAASYAHRQGLVEA